MSGAPILYRKSGKKILTWCCEIEGTPDAGKWRTISGERGGKLTTSAWKVGKPKNVGKANATTSLSQADADMQSAYRKKLDADYHYSSAEAMSVTRFKPMLAHTYGKLNPKQTAIFEAALTEGNIVVQTKFDGFRCNTGKGFKLISRKNKPFTSCPHVTAALVDTGLSDSTVIDGELYGHHEEFEDLSGMIRKQTLDDDALDRTRKGVRLYIYDCFDPDNPEATYIERMALIRAFVSDKDPILQVVDCHPITTPEEIKIWHDSFVVDGYEGAVLRHLGMPYENKRSFGLLKMKDFDEGEFRIIEVLEGEGNRAGMAAKVVVDLGDGVPCGCGMRGTVRYRKEIWAEKEAYVGGTATARYFGRTVKGQLRIAVAKVPLFKEERDV